jgi:hypothetical protein
MGGINSNVVLMIKGDGAGGSFFDKSYGYSSRVLTNRNVVISTLTSAFGGGLLYLNGNADIRTPHDPVLDFYTASQWTFDARIRLAVSNIIQMRVFGKAPNNSNRFHITVGSNGLGVHGQSNGVMCISYAAFFSASWAQNQFYHIAVTREGSIIKLFRDGLSVGGTNVTYELSNLVGSVYIGNRGDISGDMFNGYLEELRVVKGVAVWTEDFTPPTEPYTWDIPVTNISLTVPNVQPKIAVPVGFTLANGFKRDIALKRVDMGVDQIRAALMSAGFLFNPLAHHDLSIANLSVNAIGNSILISVDTTLDNISDLVSIYFSGLSFLASTDNNVEGILLYNTTASYVIGFLSYQTTIPTNEIISCKGVYIRVE